MKRAIGFFSLVVLMAGILAAPLTSHAAYWSHGRVKVVSSFADLKVKVVDSFPDLKVRRVKCFPDHPGEWQFVTSNPDFTIKYVTYNEDIRIQFVD